MNQSRDAAIKAYGERQPELRQMADQYVHLITSILDEAGINYLTVTGRAKSLASFATKTRATDSNGELLYPDPLHDIADQIGVRVITYVLGDVRAVAELLHDQTVVHLDRDLGRETASQGRFGYASRHVHIGLDPARAHEPLHAGIGDQRAQVQIRTVLQHAWAEFEHDIRYKGTIPDEHVPDFDRRFTLAAGLLELADREFSTIRERLRTPLRAGAPDDVITPRELAAFLAGQYDDAGWSRTDHYTWIADLVLALAITSLDDLAELLRAVDETLLAERMDYRYPPGAVRRLDDALLWTFGDTYIALAGNSHRVAGLTTRWAKMRGAH